MFIDTNDKTIAFHPDATNLIMQMLGTLEEDVYTLSTHAGLTDIDPVVREMSSTIRALQNVLTAGFGKAARVTPDSGGLFITEYPTMQSEGQPYVFGVIGRDIGRNCTEWGVHS